MIEVRNLTKKYAAKTVVDHISFAVHDKGITGLLGLNGAGKSTTMNMLTGYVVPTAGEILVGAYNLRENPIETKRMIGYLPEIPSLYTDMTVQEYLHFIYRLRKVRRTEKEYIGQICEKTWIGDVQRRLIGNLSKGYRQRVGIAAALIGDPKILILDEPTVGLDPKQILETRNLIQELGQNQTVIISSHILSEIQELCDHVLVMHHGQLLANTRKDALSELFCAGQALFVEIEGPAAQIWQSLMDLAGVHKAVVENGGQCGANRFRIEFDKSVDIRREVFELASRMHWPLLEMHKIEPSLEDMFLRITEQDAADREEQRAG